MHFIRGADRTYRNLLNQLIHLFAGDKPILAAGYHLQHIQAAELVIMYDELYFIVLWV